MREDDFLKQDNFTQEELDEAIQAVASTISKSEKAQLKLKAGTWQYTMTVQGIKAYYVAIDLIKRELETGDSFKGNDVNESEDANESKYMKEELEEALQTITSVIDRVGNVQPKFEEGTPQHTLAVRRIKAFRIASVLVEKELKYFA